MAIGADDDGHREAIGASEGLAESSECWRESLSWLRSRGLRGVREVVGAVRDGYGETLTHAALPRERWRRIRAGNAIERLNREIRSRTRVVGAFPGSKSALTLVTARLKYVAESEWGSRRYSDAALLDE